MRRQYLLVREQRVPAPPGRAFELYADAFRLEAITPPWLRFRVVTEAPVEMAVGTMLEYRLRLRGIPFHWRTRLEVWEPGRRFVDVQISGPYRTWRHAHEFEDDGRGGTVIRDVVAYSLPLGPVGMLAHRLLVRRELERIFDYRRDAVGRLLGRVGLH